MNFTRTTVLLAALLLSACAITPDYQDNPYQRRAFELVDRYNAAHGTHVPYPVVRIGSLANLDEGQAYCPVHADGCWLTINAAFDAQRHGPDYALSNSTPHEVAHHICVYLKLCPRGNYHGPEWQAIALELGLDPKDSFITKGAQ